MTLLINLQVQIFTMALVVGVILGILYDFLRMLRRTIKHNNVFMDIEDSIFWTLAIVVLFSFLRIENDGELRGFIVVGLMVGAMIYFRFFSKYILNIGTIMMKKVKDFVQWLAQKVVVLMKFFEKIYKKYLQFGNKVIK